MRLPADLTRCLGAGHFGATCARRNQCRRYTQRDDVGGDRHRHVFAERLCRTAQFECQIPVRESLPDTAKTAVDAL